MSLLQRVARQRNWRIFRLKGHLAQINNFTHEYPTTKYVVKPYIKELDKLLVKLQATKVEEPAK